MFLPQVVNCPHNEDGGRPSETTHGAAAADASSTKAGKVGVCCHREGRRPDIREEYRLDCACLQ